MSRVTGQRSEVGYFFFNLPKHFKKMLLSLTLFVNERNNFFRNFNNVLVKKKKSKTKGGQMESVLLQLQDGHISRLPMVPLLSLVHTCEPNGLRTAREWFANQMRICMDGTANLRCLVCKWFTHHLLQTKICRFFARTHRELEALGVLCSRQVRGKLIYHASSANCSQVVCMCVLAFTATIQCTIPILGFISGYVGSIPDGDTAIAKWVMVV